MRLWASSRGGGGRARRSCWTPRRFGSNVVGPCFEQICRDWALYYADPDLFGGLPARVGHGVAHDPKARKGHEVDVAAVGIAQDSKPPLLAIGEAKWNDVIGAGFNDRARRRGRGG